VCTIRLTDYFSEALEGLLDQIVTAEDVIRQPAIRFLKAKLGELPASANNTEIATLLINEYKKVGWVVHYG